MVDFLLGKQRVIGSFGTDGHCTMRRKLA